MTLGAADSSWNFHRLLHETRRPTSIREHPNAHWLAVGAVCIGALMSQLDASIVTVALPSLEGAFGAGVSSVTWVGLSYLVVLVGTVAAIGRLSDMRGRKLFYVYGFGLFVAASVLCGLSPNLGILCGCRALQAIGAAMLQANSLAIIVMVVPARSLGRAIGAQGAAQAIGLALGPTVGGLLVAAGGWRLIFFVNVPIGMLGAVAALLLVPRSTHLAPKAPFDFAGLATLFPCVVAVLAVITFGTVLGWSSTLIVGLFVAAVVLGWWFIRHELKSANPMMDLDLFKQRRFSFGIISGIGSYMVMFGVLLVIPFYAERALGDSVVRSGLELMFLPLCFGITAPLAGKLADRFGARPLTVSGMALVTAALVILAAARPGAVGIAIDLAVIGVGLGLFTPPNNAAIMGSVPPGQSAMASGILNMSRGIGTALGLAVSGLVFSVSGGEGGTEAAAHAFAISALVLALVAAAAGLVAAFRPHGQLGDTKLAGLEA